MITATIRLNTTNTRARQSPFVANNAPKGPGNVYGANIVIFAIKPNLNTK